MHIPRWIVLFALGLIVTLLNCAKPLQVDDAAYYYYANQIAQHPLDPYGFTILWYQHPLPANYVLAPPVVPYWWAIGIRLFGDQPFFWKLWLLPFSWLLVGSLHNLFRRFASPLELPLTCMTVFSPTFLPSLNYMLDVPALALVLASLAVFFRAADLRSWWRAGLAGVLAGVAMQTKYTALLAPVTMVIYTGVHLVAASGEKRRAALMLLPMTALAGVVAAGIFIVWEAWIESKYGESHFMLQVHNDNRDFGTQLELFSVPLLLLLGGVGAWIGILGVAAFQRRGIALIVLAIGVTLAFVMIALMGSSAEITFHRYFPIPAAWAALLITWEQVIYFALGVFVLGMMVACALSLIWGSPRDPESWLVGLWFMLEIAGYFALTPFPAVRRVMGIVTVGTIVVGRLTAKHAGRFDSGGADILVCSQPPRQKCLGHRFNQALVWWIASGQMVLGLLFYGVDMLDAWAAKRAVEAAAAQIRARDPGATIHFTGHWGFQFYGEQRGMVPIMPDDSSRPIRQGDWLVVPYQSFEQQRIQIDPAVVEFRGSLAIDDPVPLRTVQCFYGTSSGAALEHREGPRFVVSLYQATATFVPRSP